MVVWNCRPTVATDRVRLEFNTSLNDRYDVIDAVRLFNASELTAYNSSFTVPSNVCVTSGCNAYNCGGVVAGECAQNNATGPYCLCSRDFSGTHCEIEERWPVAASATSDALGALLVVGAPDMYPYHSAPPNKPFLGWAPLFSTSLTLDYQLNESLYVQQVEFFQTNSDTRMNLTSIAVGTETHLRVQLLFRPPFHPRSVPISFSRSPG